MLVVGGPPADLDAVPEGAGAHQAAILAEPFPVTGGGVADPLAFGPDGAIFMILNIRLWFLIGIHNDLRVGIQAAVTRVDSSLSLFRLAFCRCFCQVLLDSKFDDLTDQFIWNRLVEWELDRTLGSLVG